MPKSIYGLIVILFALLLSACQSANSSTQISVLQPSFEKVTEHIIIDDKIIDSGDAYRILEPVYWTANTWDGEEAYNDSLVDFSKEQRYVNAIQIYFAEVNNGGHDQFYSNNSGIVWQDALKGFQASGFSEAASILEASVQRMGGNPSLDENTRWEQIEKLQPEFDDLDEQLWKLTDLDPRIINFIKNHRSAFYFEGDVTRLVPQKPL